MGYVNRKHVHDNPVKLSLSDEQMRTLQALALEGGLQVAVMARELLKGAMRNVEVLNQVVRIK